MDRVMKKYLTIKDIRANHIYPFEIDDDKIKKLFAFFLNRAPTIDSIGAMVVDADTLEKKWKEYMLASKIEKYRFLSSSQKLEKCLAKCGLIPEAQVNRFSKAFVCKKKNKNESEPACVLRHLRNSIAHGNVYMKCAGNRKYILFEDYNKSKNKNAVILFAQSDLSRLKKEMCP